MRLKSKSVIPPGGFRYTDPDSHLTIQAASFMELVDNVNRHRSLNGMPPNPNQEQMIHDQLCDKLGSEHCEGYGLGDVVHAVAQPIARAIDKVAGTNIRGCGSCARRRAMLNS